MRALKNTMLAAMIAVGAIGCGVTPDETVSYDTAVYDTPTVPAGPTIDIVRENCESWGMVYDEANNTCLDDGGIGTESGTDKPTSSCADYGLIEENGTCVEAPLTPPVAEPEIGTEAGTDKPTTSCADYGLIEENGACVEPPLTPVTPAE